MAVSIMRPEQRESGVDTFLRRLGSVANVANAGINTYAGYKDMQAKSQAKDDANKGIYSGKELDPKDWIDAKEGEAGAQTFKVRGADGNVSDVLKRRYVAQEKAKSAEEIANTQADTKLKESQAFVNRNKPSEIEERIAAKKEEKSRLSERQIDAFTDIDNADSDLTNMLAGLGENSHWTGSIDGRIPDLMVGSDQVAWRSALGKYKDAYRKAITGAGAGPREIAILEKRLPSETDAFADFKAKAIEGQGELARRRSTLASNLEKGGKNVSAFGGGLSDLVKSPKEPKEFAGMSDADIKKAYDAKKAADAQVKPMRAR